MTTRKSKKRKSDSVVNTDNQKIFAKLESDRILSTGSDVAVRQRTYKLAGGDINVEDTAIIAETAEQSIKSLKESINSDLKELEDKSDPETIKSLDERITNLSTLANDLVNLLRPRLEIEPKLSVIQPQIKLIDANLAYKYADLQSDANNLTNFATLFLGTGLAALVSFTITYLTERNSTSLAIHSTTGLLSIFVAIIFGFLARSSNKKAREARNLLDATATVDES